ncbi:MAG: flagellar export protein FliJ [Clostridiales bacterium]|nr:flagellar export protein FliJ [Clostridiales bacterium]
MAKFTFQLQTVLNIKNQQEDNLKNELGKAVQKLEKEKAELHRLNFAKDRMIMEFNEKSRKTTVEKLKEYNAYISLLGTRIKRQKENVNKASQNVDKVREELIQAVKERKILEKLKEKKYEEYLVEANREELKVNDEVVSYKYFDNDTGDADGKE